MKAGHEEALLGNGHHASQRNEFHVRDARGRTLPLIILAEYDGTF